MAAQTTANIELGPIGDKVIFGSNTSTLPITSLASAFCREEFTVAELRRVYEIVWGTPLDPRNFHRKVTGAEGFLVETGETTSSGGGRPAQLYRRGTALLLHPPMLRPR